MKLFVWYAFLAAIFSSVAIVLLKYICIKSSEQIIRPIINLIALVAVLLLVIFTIGNLSGSKYFQIMKPSLDMNDYENKMFWITLAYLFITLIFIIFWIRSFYYSENPALAQGVVYSNLIFIYLFSVYFFKTNINIQAALGILLVVLGVSLICMIK